MLAGDVDRGRLALDQVQERANPRDLETQWGAERSRLHSKIGEQALHIPDVPIAIRRDTLAPGNQTPCQLHMAGDE
ncbi:MAG: hypothetical protein ACYS0G_04765 [Planctomycetota bacterium]